MIRTEAIENLIGALPLALIGVGVDGRIAGVNKEAEALLGYRRDEFVPAILGQSVSLPVEQLSAYRASYRNLCYSLHLKGYYPTSPRRSASCRG